MKQKIKPILTSILIGIVAFPTIAIGGSFTVSLIQGKSIPEAIQILAEQIDSLIERVTTLETRADREESCRKADEIFEEVKYVYAQIPPYIVIDAGKIDDYISGTQTILEQYKWLVESQDILCPPTPEGIETYCIKIQEMSPEIYSNRPIIGCAFWSEEFRNLLKADELEAIELGEVKYSEMINKEYIIRYLEEVYCLEKTDFSEIVQKLQSKLNRLLELKTEYLIQKEFCESE